MGKRQTRRSISVKGISYQRMKDACDQEGLSVSGQLEILIAQWCEVRGIPMPTILRPRKPSPAQAARDAQAKEHESAHFTF